MRVAAGVLLCIVAAVNILGGLAWATGGGLLVGGGAAIEQAAEQSAGEGGAGQGEPEVSVDPEQTGILKAFGGAIILYAIWLLVLAGLEIASAVFLFKDAKPVFVLVVSALEGVTDIAAMAVGSSLLFAVLGLVAAIAGLIGGTMLLKEQRAAAA